MGNTVAKTVRCQSAVDPTILPPPPPLSAPGSTPPPADGTPGGPPVNERFKNNPGTMDEFHKKCKGNWITPVFIIRYTSFGFILNLISVS